MQIRSARAIGTAIRSRRREFKLNQATLARKIGVTRHWVIEIEKGKPTAEVGLVLRALAALQLEVDVRPQHTSAAISTGVDAPLPAIDIDRIVDQAKQRGRRG